MIDAAHCIARAAINVTNGIVRAEACVVKSIVISARQEVPARSGSFSNCAGCCIVSLPNISAALCACLIQERALLLGSFLGWIAGKNIEN